MKRILKPIYKISNIIVFVCLFLVALILYLYISNIMAGIVLAILSLYMIFNKMENIEKRVRELEYEMSKLPEEDSKIPDQG